LVKRSVVIFYFSEKVSFARCDLADFDVNNFFWGMKRLDKLKEIFKSFSVDLIVNFTFFYIFQNNSNPKNCHMNKIFLIGRLVKEPEIRTTTSGKKVASFSIAVSNGKDQNGQELTQYFNCSAWEKLAEIVENYVHKGTKVAVIGKLQNRTWDKPDGTKGYSTDILANELEILTSKAESEAMAQRSGGDNSDMPQQNVDEIDVSNMPF
jgi:single-strand DNA-binding protein